MHAKAFALSLLVVATASACQLNKDGAAPFDADPNQVTPPAAQPTHPLASPNNGNNVAPPNGAPTGGGNLPLSPNGTPAPGGGNVPLAAGPRFIGRVPASHVLSWSGTGVEAQFNGTKGSATFSVVTGTSYVAVAIDDAAPTRVQVQNNVPIAFGPVAPGSHRVRMVKLNEPELGVLKFNSLTTDGALLSPSAPARRLEFVGDSITLGYGVEGTRPCSNSSAMENVLKAYSGLTASALGAEATVIAWSGHGLLRNGVGVSDTKLMPALYLRDNAADATSLHDFGTSPAPQAVIVNLGTNDFTYSSDSAPRPMLDQAAFTAAYVDFVTTLRGHYPKATIVLATSPMLSDTFPTSAEAQHSSLLQAITAVQTQLGDNNVRVLDNPTMDTTVAACDYHPSAAEQATMADALTRELKAALSW